MHLLSGVLIGPAARITRGLDRCAGVAVVAAVCRQHLVLVRVQARHADRILHRVGPAVGEEDLLVTRARAIDDALGGLAAHVVGVLRCDGRQTRGLVLDRLDDLGVLVADVDIDQLTGEVQVAVAVVVPEVAPLRGGNRQRLDLRLCAPRVEDVRAVEVVDALALGGIGGVVHGGLLCWDGSSLDLEARRVGRAAPIGLDARGAAPGLRATPPR